MRDGGYQDAEKTDGIHRELSEDPHSSVRGGNAHIKEDHGQFAFAIGTAVMLFARFLTADTGSGMCRSNQAAE